MNSNTKILFLDLDGTLLNDSKKITEGNAGAILEALAAGHKVVLSTGRASSSALRLARQLHLNLEGCYAITFNGGCLYDLHTEQLITRTGLPLWKVRFLMDAAAETGVHAQTYFDGGVLTERDSDDLQQYLTNTSMEARIVPDVCEVLPEEPCKVLLADYFHRGRIPGYIERIRDWAEGRVDYFYSCEELLEIVPVGVSKGNAIRRLCEHLQIPMENTISAGDAENDISMLQTTAVSVVMRNASPEMYSYGTYITERDNNHDGIEEVIRKFML